MTKIIPQKKANRVASEQARADALKLLRGQLFFNDFLSAVKKMGLAGEEKNALVVLIVVISALLERPLNLTIKGVSAAGKNFLAKVVLYLFPRDARREVSSMSAKALHYASMDFRHRVLYLQERNRASGPVHPIRLLISEGRLVHYVPVREGSQWVTKKIVARGPVASISTTTKARLEIDDETRHVSIFINESKKQSLRVMLAYHRNDKGLTPPEKRVWRIVYRLLKERSTTIGIRIPEWFDQMAEKTNRDDIRVRRYYPALVEACKTIALIRSFQTNEPGQHQSIEVSFADFAMAVLIFDDVFVESIHGKFGPSIETSRAVERICKEKGRSIRCEDFAEGLSISTSRAYRLLRKAEAAGTIRLVNKPEKNNPKFFRPVKRRFAPDPEELFNELPEVGDEARFVHPVTGDLVIYRRRKPRNDV